MGIQITEGLTVRATLCEIERGLFHVTYSVDGAGPGRHYLPRYQVGTCASDAKQRIEQRAQECGYETVIWEPTLAHPSLVRSPAKESARPVR
jgi:hypothetical protein